MVKLVDLGSRGLDEIKIQRDISQIVGNELSNLSKPCYFPKLIRYKEDLNRMLKIQPEDLAEFRRGLEPKVRDFVLINEAYTATLIQGILYFTKKGNRNIALLLYHILGIKFQSSMMHKLFPKFCSDDIWRAALDKLSIKHLYKVKNDIPSSILYLSETLFNKYEDKMKSGLDDITLVRMVYEYRHRLAQSAKSFAELCHKLAGEKSSSDNKNTDEDESNDIQLVADKISMSMCTFGQINQQIVDEAVKRSGIRKEIGYSIVAEVSDVEYRNNIRFIIVLLGRLVTSVKEICNESKRNTLVRKILSGNKIGNYSPKDQIIHLINSLESSFRYKSYNSEQLVAFLSQYITLYIQSKIC